MALFREEVLEQAVRDVESYVADSRFERDSLGIKTNFVEPVLGFIGTGGKRLRPNLFLTTLKALGVEDLDQHQKIAAALELAHNATLVIDDIEDSSDLRRNQPTMHIARGLDVAVNTGVTMQLLPLVLLQKTELDQVYAEEIINVYLGQTIDITWHRGEREEISPEQYLEMCRLKTGGLLRMTVRFACVVAAAKKEVEDSLVRFAEGLGIAFQIKDDILDLEADPENFGKTYGNDISEGKMSLPVLIALSQLDSSKQAELKGILSAKTKDRQQVERARELILETSGIEEARSKAEKVAEESWQELDQIELAAAGKEELRVLAESFIKREK